MKLWLIGGWAAARAKAGTKQIIACDQLLMLKRGQTLFLSDEV
jgi:hypothetical protein